MRVSTVIAVLLTVGVVAAAGLGGRAVRDRRPVLIDFVAARNYSGWLVVSWNCAGGQRLADSLSAGRRYELRFPETGAICLANAVPANGYDVLGYRHAGRLDDGDPDDGFELVASPFLRVGPTRIEASVSAPTAIDPAIGATTDHRYDVAWVEVIRRPETDDSDAFPTNELRLGNQCDLDRFLQQRFAEPAANVVCGPIPTRQDAGLPGQRVNALDRRGMNARSPRLDGLSFRDRPAIVVTPAYFEGSPCRVGC